MMRRLAFGATVLALLLFAETCAAVPYAQLSSSENQLADLTPKVVTLNQNDAVKNITNANGVITFGENGAYFMMAAAQVGSAGGKGRGRVRLWFRLNGQDVPNSNTEQTVYPGFTAVLVCQGVGEVKAGDKLEVVYCASSATETLGLIASRPKGEPAVPSMIFTAFKVDDRAYAQVSSSVTQPAAVASRITLNSPDAMKEIANDSGALTVKTSGAYFVMAAGQVGCTAPSGRGRVRLWMRQNGRDVANSNSEQSVFPGYTAVLVCQGVLVLKAGDRVELMQSGAGAGVGMIATAPPGEPVVPSLILSVVKVADDAYAQLSSVKTTRGAPFAQLITLNQTDASRNVQLARGGTLSSSISKQTISVWQDGVYFMLAAAQVGRISGADDGWVRIWLRQNNYNIGKSNTEQTIVGDFTAVLVSQGVGEAKKGDRLQLFYSARNSNQGLIATAPKGEPIVPSMIFSLVKLD